MARSRGRYQQDHPEVAKARQRVLGMIDTLDPREIVATIKKRPSLRGILLGYLAELMFETQILGKIKDISDIRKHDDHDRTMNKADVDFIYRGQRRYSIQVKSIQTNSIRYDPENKRLVAVVQNDGSDKRDVKLPGGLAVTTTLYRRGDYDILAVPMFPFTSSLDFAYKRNYDCRGCESSRYSEKIRKLLLASTEPITYPLSGGWTTRIEDLLDDKIGTPVSKTEEAASTAPKRSRKGREAEVSDEIWKQLLSEADESEKTD